MKQIRKVVSVETFREPIGQGKDAVVGHVQKLNLECGHAEFVWGKIQPKRAACQTCQLKASEKGAA